MGTRGIWRRVILFKGVGFEVLIGAIICCLQLQRLVEGSVRVRRPRYLHLNVEKTVKIVGFTVLC